MHEASKVGGLIRFRRLLIDGRHVSRSARWPKKGSGKRRSPVTDGDGRRIMRVKGQVAAINYPTNATKQAFAAANLQLPDN
jgi:hypothetical protein